MMAASRGSNDVEPRGSLPTKDRTGSLAKGPVQTLCEEIGFRFDRSLEREDVFVAFVRQLVDVVEDGRNVSVAVAQFTGKSPSEGSATVLALARAMLDASTRAERLSAAAAVHDACWELKPDEAYPTDHVIDMVSSCASAIRFGLGDDFGLRSRHAAAAADHVWRQRYGISLFDRYSPKWGDAWACDMLLNAIVSLLPPAPERSGVSGAIEAPLGAPDVGVEGPGEAHSSPTKAKHMTTERLRELAVRATAGPWAYELDDEGSSMGWVVSPCEMVVKVAGDSAQQAENAAYIAAANPTAILSLLDELDALRKAVGEMVDKARECERFDAENLAALDDDPKSADAFSFTPRMYWRGRAGVTKSMADWFARAARKGSDHDN